MSYGLFSRIVFFLLFYFFNFFFLFHHFFFLFLFFFFFFSVCFFFLCFFFLLFLVSFFFKNKINILGFLTLMKVNSGSTHDAFTQKVARDVLVVSSQTVLGGTKATHRQRHESHRFDHGHPTQM